MYNFCSIKLGTHLQMINFFCRGRQFWWLTFIVKQPPCNMMWVWLANLSPRLWDRRCFPCQSIFHPFSPCNMAHLASILWWGYSYSTIKMRNASTPKVTRNFFSSLIYIKIWTKSTEMLFWKAKFITILVCFNLSGVHLKGQKDKIYIRRYLNLLR